MIQLYLRMRYILIALIFWSQSSLGQGDSTIHFKELGLTIQLPSDYKIADTTVLAEVTKDTKKTYNEVMKKDVNISFIKNLIIARKDGVSFFALDYNTSPKITKDNWKQVNKSDKVVWLRTFDRDFETKADTSNSIVIIDNVKFLKYQLKYVADDKLIIYMIYLTTFYKDHYIGINYFYGDNSKNGEELENMLKTSKFDK